MEFYLDSDEVRSIILNAHKIKEFNKCPDCEGTGWENWDPDGGDVKPGHIVNWDDDRDEGECEKCSGVGYVDFTMYD